MGTQSFHVGNQVPGGVVLETGRRPAPAASPLVKQDDSIPGGVKDPTLARAASGPGAAMQVYRRFTTRVTALFIVNAVTVRHLKHS
jgi:hypothetical protein